MKTVSLVLAVFALWYFSNNSALAGPKCGGGGGTQTKTYTCGPGQYLMGLSAVGGAFVHSIKFQCTDFAQSAKIGAGDPTGPFAGNATWGGGSCPNQLPVNFIQTYCGAYVDSIRDIGCSTRHSNGAIGEVVKRVTVNVGGGGGSRKYLECPLGQAIYRVRVKYGSWIDSIEVFCR